MYHDKTGINVTVTIIVINKFQINKTCFYQVKLPSVITDLHLKGTCNK